MTMRLSELFGMDIFTVDGERKGKVYDLVINLEKGRVETITMEPLKVKSKQEARKIINEKSVPYRKVKSAKDILVVDMNMNRVYDDEVQSDEEPEPLQRQRFYRPKFNPRR